MTNGGPRHETGKKKKIGGPKPAPKAPKASLRRKSLLTAGLAGQKSR